MMAQVIRATFWQVRLNPQIQGFNVLKHAIYPCMNNAGGANSECLSFVALSNNRRSDHFRSYSLRRREAQVDLDPRYGRSSYTEESEASKISRNNKKREARQAVRWGMDLASFSAPQIKRILRVASLEGEEIFGAIMLAKRLGPDVREGKRRQFNYIGKLLRDVNPELLGALIQATKDGDHATINALSGAQEAELDEEEDESEPVREEEDEEEDSQQFVALANKWFDGLIKKDIDISNEVYSISGVEFDRQELRRLVRKAQLVEQPQRNVDENVEENFEEKRDKELKAAQGSLSRFLLKLAKQTSVQQYHVE